MNRILVVENGKVVRHKTIHHYQVPSLIYDYLTRENSAPSTTAIHRPTSERTSTCC